MIRDIEHETMPREDLEALQLRRLQAVVERVYHLVPFYRRRMDELGVKPEHIRTLEDLRLLPFTTKQDLRDNYPFGMFAAPMDQIVRIHASSGTTGKPTPVAYTQRDLETWSELMARTLAAAGAHRGDIVHVAYGYGLFTGGLGVHYGAERLGAAVIPVSGGQTRRQIMLIQDFGPTVLCCTPSFALYLAEVGQEMGVDFAKTKLRVGIFGAEPWTEGMRQEIEKRLSLDAVDIYGLSEIMGPGVAIECLEAKKGLHMFEDHFLPEIINPVTLEPLAPGETGRTGHHHPHQGGLPAAALPHPGHHLAELRPLHMRPHHRPHQPLPGPERRHAHHPGRERLPVPDRVRAPGNPGSGAPLPAHRRPGRDAGHPGGPGGSG